jgi:hypothetical protein
VHKVASAKSPLILATGRDQQFGWVMIQHHAVIAAGPHRPTALVKQPPTVSQLVERWFVPLKWVPGWERQCGLAGIVIHVQNFTGWSYNLFLDIGNLSQTLLDQAEPKLSEPKTSGTHFVDNLKFTRWVMQCKEWFQTAVA